MPSCFKKRLTENNPECKQLKSGCLFLFKHSSLCVSFAGESNTCSWPIYIFWAQCSSPSKRMYLTLCRNAMLSHSVVSDSLSPYGLWPARHLCPWGFSRQEYWSELPCLPPGNTPHHLGIKPRSPALQVDSLPSEPPGKTKNTQVGSLSILQGIFPTQELNWGLLHCRWILYQLSYQEGW